MNEHKYCVLSLLTTTIIHLIQKPTQNFTNAKVEYCRKLYHSLQFSLYKLNYSQYRRQS